MQEYKYQMHVHTCPCSGCGHISPAELCKALKDFGYQGTVLTNHFFHGYSGIDRELPWKDFIACYEKDYLDCLEEAKKYDLDIIFGIEEMVVKGLEVLCYGITPKVLYDHSELRDCSLEEFSKIMRENNVVVIQAHPYREAPYIPEPSVLPLEFIDGIEAHNSCNATEKMNQDAFDFAKQYPHLILTSGGDAHHVQRLCYGGIKTTTRIRTSEDLARILRAGSYELIVGETLGKVTPKQA